MRVKYKGLIQLGSVARAECLHLTKTAVEYRSGEQCKPCKGRGQGEGTRWTGNKDGRGFCAIYLFIHFIYLEIFECVPINIKTFKTF